MEALHRVKIVACSVSPVHGPGGFLMDRLKAQLHADVFLFRQIRQKRHGLRRQAIRAGGNRNSHNLFRGHGRPVQIFQSVKGAIGIGKGLKICDIMSIIIFCCYKFFGFYNLFIDRL